MQRRDKTNYYLDIAETVAKRSTCLRRHYGAVIVNHDEIVSTGYVGAPRGRQNCSDLNRCIRMELKIPRGQRYELCRSVHAEANAIIAAPRDQMLDAELYMCCTQPGSGEIISGICSCMMCKRMVLNAGISRVIVREDSENYTVFSTEDWVTHDDSLEGKFGY